jgi:hypothetical protein
MLTISVGYRELSRRNWSTASSWPHLCPYGLLPSTDGGLDKGPVQFVVEEVTHLVERSTEMTGSTQRCSPARDSSRTHG